jgi:outer membrane immunogenic protein
MLRKCVGFVASALVAAVLSVTPALADRPAIWTGAYIGATAGGGWGKFKIEGESENASGFVGGVYGGYNWQAGNLVFGLEGDATWGDINKAERNIFATGDELKLANNFLGSIRGRLGVTSGAALFYATAGIAFGDFDLSYREPGFATFKVSDSRTGFVVGGGVDYMFTPNFVGRVEGLYYSFGDIFKDDGLGDNLKYDTFVVRGGLSYKF